MKRKVIWIIISALLLLSMVLASCAQATSPTSSSPAQTTSPQTTASQPPSSSATVSTTTPPPTTTVTTANWWDKWGMPQYGGAITLRTTALSTTDFGVSGVITEQNCYWYESLWNIDMTVNRDIWPFQTNFLAPEKYMTGCLAESWEEPDPQTIIVHLRQGVHWQNKSPVNGREFTANDVVNHYKLNWTNPIYIGIGSIDQWESVTALDEDTVQFKFKHPGANWFNLIADPTPVNSFEAPEWDALGEAAQKDWHNAVGTGPWMLTNYVSGSSMTFSKNPDYWGYDRRYPQNRLPYADTISLLCIPDPSTATAALRTGKVDILGEHTSFAEPSITWRQENTLKQSNPDLEFGKVLTQGPAIDLRCDSKPFSDIRVREALQMSLDLKAIAKTYYGGTVDGTPCGFVSPVLKGYAFAYADWPQSLKDQYAYNPTEAKQLLTDAGYPDGFNTDIVASTSQDIQLLQVIQSQFKDIGVNMSINQMDPTTWDSFVSAEKQDAMVYNFCGFDTYPTLISHRWSGNKTSNYTFNNDATYDKIYTDFWAATNPDKAQQLMQQADERAIEMHWSVDLFPVATYIAWQPHLKGYSGELRLFFGGQWLLAHLWTTKQ